MFKTSLAAAFAALLFSAQALAEPVLIRFSHVVAEDTPKGKGALLFKQLAEERLAGKVKVEVYPNSSLFGDADELEALRNNQVQLLAPSLAKFEQYTQQLQVFDLPFLFDDLEAVKRFQRREKSRELLRSMATHNIYGLAYWNNGMKQLSATRALTVPADAAGLAFRIQPSAILESQFAQIGARSVRLPFSETLGALQAGTVQGAENPWSNIVSQQLGSVQPYITESNHGALSYMLISNSSFWTSMPYQLRVQLEAIIDEVSLVVNREAEALNARDRQRLVDAGNQIISLTPEQRAAWREAMQPTWKHYEAQIGSDVLRAAQTVNRR